MKNIKIIVAIFGFLFLAVGNLFAQNVTVLYSGQTHAMLYPCSCPIQQDGGVARRATLVKELRKKDPQLLLLDCGNFTAGGLMDEYTQSVQLDMARSQVNYKSMELMNYDAVAIGSEEFNFGKDFFLKNVKKNKPAYLSANLETENVIPYVIKNAHGVKVGIIGLTGLSAHQKTEGLKINEPKNIAELISLLKKDGVGVIILLSTLGEQQDLKLILEVKGIDILFVGQKPLKDEALTKIDATFLVRPNWQGRKLGKLNLEVKDGRLLNCKVDELRLSDKLVDNTDIAAILPHCYADANCKSKGLIGSCLNPGTLNASCSFKVPNKVNLTVVTAKDCSICNTEEVIDGLKKKFPGIMIQYVYYPDPGAQKVIQDLSIQGLPAYIFGKEVDKEDNFYEVKDDFSLIKDRYLFKLEKTGMAYFLNRPVTKGSFDLFFSLFKKDALEVLAATQEMAPKLHFLVTQTPEGFVAKNGALEVEEYLRAVCVKKYYPQKFWDYLLCRAKNINSSYWDDCLGITDISGLKSCARGPEGQELLKENTDLNKELKIMFGPTYFLNNREVFSTQGKITKQGLKKIIKK